ncbi:hypothetical protein OESDEN_21538 [Oesophagostomum dentatum]|uniref:Uncharacterized protein n=1 Tax=Oesophagostomum dentatum TaxID=61180 RepID=A0A0B1S4M6_OESDE|nr:hypothetical protein OESDEN_21538 [Oesophagostomum dentatum]
MPVPIGAICTGIGLFLYFWLLIFLDGLIARLMGSSKCHIDYSREEQYIAEMLSDAAITPFPLRIPTSDTDFTQESLMDAKEQ